MNILSSTVLHPRAAGARDGAILPLFDGRRTLREVALRHAVDRRLEPVKALIEVESFARDALRLGVLAPAPGPDPAGGARPQAAAAGAEERRGQVRAFYGEAAEAPRRELCCLVRPAPEDLTHIPQEVVERFYGCGSPVGLAGIGAGERTLDLGSGAGIEVFIAAKRVGPTGKAIGVDMTDEMLAVARGAQGAVAARLGYDAVEFRKGYLEEIPLESGSVDLVTSNCVINLSPDKARVFAEAWRVLRDGGRLVAADIVSEGELPPALREDPRLWGECLAGALSEEELLRGLERAGFHGVQFLRRAFWKEVAGCRFHSVTVRGYKFTGGAGGGFAGHTVTYQGPFRGVADDEGRWFPRGMAVEVSPDTAARLARPPYRGMFLLGDPSGGRPADYSCEGEGCCS